MTGITAHRPVPGLAWTGAPGLLPRLLRAGGWVLALYARLLADAVALIMAVALTLALACGLLAWRLSAGPLDVSWLVVRLVAMTNEGSLLDGAAFGDGAAKLTVGRAELSWAAFRDGPGASLRLVVGGITAAGRGGAERVRLNRLEAEFAPADLLRQRYLPGVLDAQGVQLHVTRAEDGAWSLGLGLLPPPQARAGSPGRPGAAGKGGDGGGGPSLAEQLGPLRRVRIHDAAVTVQDRKLGVPWHVSGMDVEAMRDGARLSAAAMANLAVGGVRTTLQVQADQDEAGTTLHAGLSPISPAALARAVPQFAELGVLDAPVGLELDATLDQALRPRTAHLRSRVAEGSATLLDDKAAFTGAALDATAEWSPGQSTLMPDRLHVGQARLVLPSPSGGQPSTLAVSGDAVRAGGRVRMEVALTLDQARFADLPTIWPKGMAPNPRAWITKNITAGAGRDGAFALTLEAPADLSDVSLTALSGQMRADDLTVHWLRPVPPAVHANGLMTFRGPDVVEIRIDTGRQGALRIHDGLVRITGLAKKDQDIAISLGVTGPLAEIVQLLKHPRLKLLSKQKLPLNGVAGTAEVRLGLSFPLLKNLDLDDLKVRTEAQLSGVRLRGLVAGRDLERGQLKLALTQDGMQLAGQAQLAGIPAGLRVDFDFRSGPPSQVLLRAAVNARVSDQQLARLGLDTGTYGSGVAGLAATYAQHRSGRAEVDVRADLRDVAVQTPVWSKPRGAPAQASARVVLQDDRLVAVDRVHAEGPGLLVDGSADLAAGKPSVLRLTRAMLGRTSAQGEIRLPVRPGDRLVVALSGPVLDVAQYLRRQPVTGSATRPPSSQRRPSPQAEKTPGTPYLIDLRFGQVVLGANHAVGPVLLQAESDGQRILRARLDALPLAQGWVVPDAGGRQLYLALADTGTLLRTLGVTKELAGGQLRVAGRFEDQQPGAPLHATAELADFRVFEAVIVGKVLQAVTLYGVLDALRGPGLAFTRAIVPFTWWEAAEVLDLREARAYSSSLGITAQGRIDLGRKLLDVRGTVVPAYFFNALLGRIPFVGRLFSAETGGGLVSAAFGLHGKLDDPGISVNPLTLLTPGILRRIFRIFD